MNVKWERTPLKGRMYDKMEIMKLSPVANGQESGLLYNFAGQK